jgi:hypothetical protein
MRSKLAPSTNKIRTDGALRVESSQNARGDGADIYSFVDLKLAVSPVWPASGGISTASTMRHHSHPTLLSICTGHPGAQSQVKDRVTHARRVVLPIQFQSPATKVGVR